MLEKDLQEYLMGKGQFFPEENKFNENIYFCFSEFHIGKERIDILGFDDYGNIYVIELKKGIIDANALIQCKNYMIGVERLLNINKINYNPKIRGILVGSEIDSRTKTVLSSFDNMNFIEFKNELIFGSKETIPNNDFYIQYENTAKEIENSIRMVKGEK